MTRFQALALEEGIENIQTYKSSNLKRRIIQECPEIVFIPQLGMSHLVCDATISLGDALKKMLDKINIFHLMIYDCRVNKGIC